MPLAEDETPAAALKSLTELELSPPDDRETLLRVLDISRGYVMRHLMQPSRILPAVQERIDEKLAEEIWPLVRKAQDLILTWKVGKIRSAGMSAEGETKTLLDRFTSESTGTLPAYSATHAMLIEWLEGHQAKEPSLWREAWEDNRSFSAYKKPWLLHFLQDMESQGMIGDAVLDAGAGRVAASDYVGAEGRRIVQADIAADSTKPDVLLVKVNLEDAEGAATALPKMQRFWRREKAQTIICSHILNYVDFRTLIGRLHELHEPGGRLVIFNQPFEGESEAFSAKGVCDNYDLLTFLPEEGYEIEYVQAAPWVHVNDFDKDLRAKSLLVIAKG